MARRRRPSRFPCWALLLHSRAFPILIVHGAPDRILQWRGDVLRTGAQLDVTVPEAEPVLHWRQNGLHKGQHAAAKSSPVVLNDGTFIQAGDTGILYRLSIETGDVLWSAAQKRLSNFGYHSTPCVVYGAEARRHIVKKDSSLEPIVKGGRRLPRGQAGGGYHHNDDVYGDDTATKRMDLVIIGSYDGVLSAWDLQTGLLVWENAQDVGMHIGASPACTASSVYITVEFSDPVGGGLCKLRLRDGVKEWCNYEMADHSHSSPAVDVQKDLVVAGSNDGHLHVFRDTDGVRLAAYDVSSSDAGKEKEVKGAILLFEGVAIFGSWAQKIHAFDLNHLASGSASPRLASHDKPTVNKLETVPVLFWNSSPDTPGGAFPVHGRAMSSVALDPESELLYFGSHDHYVRCVEMRTGKLVWKYRTDSYVLSSGVVAKNAFLIGSSDGHVYAFHKSMGALMWRFRKDRTGRITSTPGITKDGKYIIFNSDTYGFTQKKQCKSSVGAVHVLKRQDLLRDEL